MGCPGWGRVVVSVCVLVGGVVLVGACAGGACAGAGHRLVSHVLVVHVLVRGTGWCRMCWWCLCWCGAPAGCCICRCGMCPCTGWCVHLVVCCGSGSRCVPAWDARGGWCILAGARLQVRLAGGAL